jgi:hypothetical protein
MNSQAGYMVPEEGGVPNGVKLLGVVLADLFALGWLFTIFDNAALSLGQGYYLADTPLIGVIFDRPGLEETTGATVIAFMLAAFTQGSCIVFWHSAMNNNILDKIEPYHANKQKFIGKVLIWAAYLLSICIELYFLTVRIQSNTASVGGVIPSLNNQTENWELWMMSGIIIFINVLLGVANAHVIATMKEGQQ